MIAEKIHCVILPFRRFVVRIFSGQRHARINVVFIFLFFLAVTAIYNSDHLMIALLNKLNVKSSDRDEMSSYCSLEADRSGPHQNVIAYSLYGDFSESKHSGRYINPLKFILPSISKNYPGSILYYNLNAYCFDY